MPCFLGQKFSPVVELGRNTVSGADTFFPSSFIFKSISAYSLLGQNIKHKATRKYQNDITCMDN